MVSGRCEKLPSPPLRHGDTEKNALSFLASAPQCLSGEKVFDDFFTPSRYHFSHLCSGVRGSASCFPVRIAQRPSPSILSNHTVGFS